MKALSASALVATIVLVVGQASDPASDHAYGSIVGPDGWSASEPAISDLGQPSAHSSALHSTGPLDRRVGAFAYAPPEPEELSELVDAYCVRCHNERRLRGNLSLDGFDVATAADNASVAERMIRKLRAGMMPPPGVRRPEGDSLTALAATLEQIIDEAAEAAPRPGTRTFQRLNRAEYEAQIASLLGITVDASEWLPADQISASFDNIADAQPLSQTLMEAYLTAASEVARFAIGNRHAPVTAKTYTTPSSASQHEWERVEGAPYGTRGGISVLHSFPADGEYTLSMSFMLGWGERFHDIDVSVDGERVALLRYGGDIDFQGRKSFPIETEPVFIRAGQRRVTAAFVRRIDGPYEDLIRPHDWSLTGTEASYGTTSVPHIMSMTLEGPFNPVGVSDTPTRRHIFTCRPTTRAEEQPCAERIVASLAEQAYGRPVSQNDVSDLMRFYELGAEEGGFEDGVRTALEAVLSSPYFLFRLESEPEGLAPGSVYAIEGLDLATRLSFFLWGTSPDAQLIDAAQSGALSEPAGLEREARRLLADPRSDALATRFAAMWLRLQDLEQVQPDAFWFPNYSQQLAGAMREETERFFAHLVREDRSFLELFDADYTFLNERLADHYGVRGVLGEEFRRVSLESPNRRGILGHGSVLTQTSLGNRTSPVLRGKWVMEVLLGTPPPPPPPDVPELDETEDVAEGRVLSTRERMEIHRANPSCASCHNIIDPIGLALDNFDVTGKWRIREHGAPLDTRGRFYDGTEIASPEDLAQVLLKRPLPLVRTFTRNLMAYAVGRRVEVEDQPAIRSIVDRAARDDYAMSSLIVGVVLSDAFRLKQASAVIDAEAQPQQSEEQRLP